MLGPSRHEYIHYIYHSIRDRIPSRDSNRLHSRRVWSKMDVVRRGDTLRIVQPTRIQRLDRDRLRLFRDLWQTLYQYRLEHRDAIRG